jgi:phosphate transport system protein
MSIHLDKDLTKLKIAIQSLGLLTTAAVNNAIHSLVGSNSELAKKVLAQSSEIDEKEVLIEEECLKMLALHQPVAKDLRHIVAILKVNNDLERMGDFADNIAKRALAIDEGNKINVPQEFIEVLPSHIEKMLKLTLESLLDLDVAKAQQVIEMDDFVDDINKQMYSDIKARIKENIADIDSALSFLSSSRYIERIADLTTNIAEDVIFMVEGEVVRHKG